MGVDPGDLELMARGPGGQGLKPRHWAGARASIISTAAFIMWGAPVLPMEPAREAGSDHLLGLADGLPGGTAVGGSVDPGDLELMARGSGGPGLKPLHWAPLLPLLRRLLSFCGGRQ